MPKFQVLQPIVHDGKRYIDGTIDLKDDTAIAQLIAAGAIAAPRAPAIKQSDADLPPLST